MELIFCGLAVGRRYYFVNTKQIFFVFSFAAMRITTPNYLLTENDVAMD